MFIGRRLDGTIYGAWTQTQPQDEHHLGMEEVADNHPDYVAFRDRKLNRPAPINPLVEIDLLKTKLSEKEIVISDLLARLLIVEEKLKPA